jgi:branched-chain amino acid transport system substrate-binding protein
MSRACLLALVLVHLLAIASCVSSATGSDSQPIVIGIYADLSSTGAQEGNDVLKGAQLRVREANEARGVNGRAVELKYLDMKQNPTEAVKSYTALAQEMGACAVIGSAVPNAGVAVSPVADMVKVPLLSLSFDDRVTTPELKPDALDAVGPARRYVFLVQPSGSQIAIAMAAYAVDRFSLRRYATLSDPTSAVSLIQARSFENALKKAGKVIAVTAEIPQGEADYGSAMARLKDADVEAVFICGTAEQNAALARKAGEMSYRPTLIGNQAWYFPLLEEVGDSVEGAYFAMGVAPDDRALAQLSARFQAAFGEPPRPEVLPGYEAVGLVLAAVRKAGTANPQKVRDALEQTTGYKGLLSTFEMDRKTHRPVDPPIAVMRIMARRYMTLEARFSTKSGKSPSLLRSDTTTGTP